MLYEVITLQFFHGITKLGRAFRYGIFKKLLMPGQNQLMLLHLIKHIIEAINQHTYFIGALFFGPHGIILTCGNQFHYPGQIKQGSGNRFLQQPCQQKA